MARRSPLFWALPLLVVLSVAVTVAAPALTFTFKTIQIPGASSTGVYGINNSGVMVGSYVDGQGKRHGFMLAGAVLTNIDDPNGTNTYCFAINKSGVIVGEYTTATRTLQAFLYQGGAFT